MRPAALVLLILSCRPVVAAAGELWRFSATITLDVEVHGEETRSITTPVRPTKLVPVSSVTVRNEGVLADRTSGRAFINAVLVNEGAEGEVFFSDETEPVSISVGGSYRRNSLSRTVETVNGTLSEGHESSLVASAPLTTGQVFFQDTVDVQFIQVDAGGEAAVYDRRRRVERGEWRDLEPFRDRRGEGVGMSCAAGDPGFRLSRSGDGYSVSCREEERTTRRTQEYGEVIGVTTRTLTASFRPAGSLRADAGGPYRIERGGRVTLDGSDSSGPVRSYTWTLEPSGECPAWPSAGPWEMGGAVVETTLLCPVRATLTVTGAGKTDSDTAAVEVTPRGWKTSFEHVPAEGLLEPSEQPIYPTHGQPKYTGGANTCSIDGNETDDSHVLHPAAAGGTWEDRGFAVVTVDDPGGPFDGVSHLSDYRVRVSRGTLLNAYIIPGGRPIWSGLETFYDKNRREGGDVDGYLAAVRDHEREHSRRWERWLSGNDPGPGLEKESDADREALKQRADAKLKRAEHDICVAGLDPLPVTWTGFLWFGADDASANWIRGETRVGGTPPDGDCPPAE